MSTSNQTSHLAFIISLCHSKPQLPLPLIFQSVFFSPSLFVPSFCISITLSVLSSAPFILASISRKPSSVSRDVILSVSTFWKKMLDSLERPGCQVGYLCHCSMQSCSFTYQNNNRTESFKLIIVRNNIIQNK